MADDPTATTVPIQDTPNVANDGAAPNPPSPAGGGTPPVGAGAPPAPALPTDNRPAPTLTPTPMVKPKRGGLGGVMDDLLDDIAGTKGQPKLTQGNDGNYYVETPELSRKGQWLKVANEALHGAAAGAAAKPGPGQQGRALEAGVNAGDKMAAQQQDQRKEMSQEAKQNNQDLFNQIKLKHDMAAKEFELGRMKVQATQGDVKFAQEQTDRMMKLTNEGKAFDLGTYKDEAELSKIKDVNPNFWKDVYKNDITVVPQIGSDGQRNGIRVFQTTPGIGNEMVEPGTAFKVFTPPAKPGDPPTLQDQVATVPMTQNQKHAYDLSAWTQMQNWQKSQEEEALKGTEAARNASEIPRNAAEANKANADAQKAREKQSGTSGYLERPDGTVWIGTQGEAEQGGLPFEAMKPGDIQKDKQAMRQLNDVQMNASRYTRAARIYSDSQSSLTYHGKPVSESNPVHPEGPLSLIGMGGKLTTSAQLRERDNTNLNTLMNKAGYADINASISSGGHIEVPVITAFGQSLSRQIGSKAYSELSDQGKDLYDGYLRTLSAVPAYIKALTSIGRSNKEILDLELANIKHPGYAPGDILRGQEAFQQNIDKAADGFPRNMVGVPHPSDIRRKIEENGGNPELPEDVKRLLNGMSPSGTGNQR